MSVSEFSLANGMQVVVIPDHRAPVATHMVYYRNGGADDPLGKSGIAHFLEHLMFKGTAAHPKGAFSDIVAELGGQENAFTSYDYTAYFQRVAKDHLGRMMELEADRMTGLVLDDAEVLSERDVVIEERKMRTDSDPAAQLQESLLASLYLHHPYGTPIIGWGHEIEELGREDALAYYRRFYAPENAILLVAGDVDAENVRQLADATYGRVPRRGNGAPVRRRPQEPSVRTRRLVSLADAKVEQPSLQRAYLVPSQATAKDNEAFALELLSHLLGGGSTSRLYKALVMDEAVAVGAGSWYWGEALDQGQFGVYAVPAEGVVLATLDEHVEAVVQNMKDTPVPDAELQRAKTRLVADLIYAQDNQAHLARIYGATLATGGRIADVSDWPARIEAVTAEEIRAAASRFLDVQRSVTGYLEKSQTPPEKSQTRQAA